MGGLIRCTTVWCIWWCQNWRRLFIGRYWIYSRSDCCSRTMWGHRMLELMAVLNRSLFVLNIFWLILLFYKGENWTNIFTNSYGHAGRGFRILVSHCTAVLAELKPARFCPLVVSDAARSIYQTDGNFWPNTFDVFHLYTTTCETQIKKFSEQARHFTKITTWHSICKSI